MNIDSNIRKVYNKSKYNQIDEDDLTAENFGEAAYRAGQYDMAKLLIKLFKGELTDNDLEMELAKLEPTEAVN